MAKNRWINTTKWDDEWHRSIGIVGRGLFDYLLTNSLSNLLGVYSISLPRMAFDTGIDESELKKLLAKFEEDGRVFFEVVNGTSYIVMKNWLKHQKLGPKTAIPVVKDFNALPQTLRVKLVSEDSPLLIDLDKYICIPYGYTIDNTSHLYLDLDSNLDLNSDSNLDSNKERLRQMREKLRKAR